MGNSFVGRLVRLRAPEIGDWETFYRWDYETTDEGQNTDEIWFPNSKEAARTWMEAQAKQRHENDEYRFQIERLEGGELVGTINTHTLNRRCGTFMYGLAVLPQYRKCGYGREALALVLRYYFHERRFQKVNAEVYSFNTPSIRFHESLGFQLEGRLRRMVYTNGQLHDALIYGMTREEFEATHWFPNR